MILHLSQSTPELVYKWDMGDDMNAQQNYQNGDANFKPSLKQVNGD